MKNQHTAEKEKIRKENKRKRKKNKAKLDLLSDGWRRRKRQRQSAEDTWIQSGVSLLHPYFVCRYFALRLEKEKQ